MGRASRDAPRETCSVLFYLGQVVCASTRWWRDSPSGSGGNCVVPLVCVRVVKTERAGIEFEMKSSRWEVNHSRTLFPQHLLYEKATVHQIMRAKTALCLTL